MGGHGAITLHLRNPETYRSVSAFAPICNPTASDWGQKQFQAYLGSVEAGELNAGLYSFGNDLASEITVFSRSCRISSSCLRDRPQKPCPVEVTQVPAKCVSMS